MYKLSELECVCVFERERENQTVNAKIYIKALEHASECCSRRIRRFTEKLLFVRSMRNAVG
jgi:hypothetical protein